MKKIENIEIIKCTKWKIEKEGEFINEKILFFPISGIENIGIDEIKKELTKLTTSTTVRKELVELSKEIISRRPKKKKKDKKESLILFQ